MKTISMKKFFSLLLCLCMLLSMNIPAFAAEGEENTCSHEWNEGTVTTPATCTTEGVMTFTCTVDGCGKTKTEPIPAAHSWNEGTVTLEPTCVAEGVKTFTCTADGCGVTKTEPIPATDVHNYVDGFCTNDGCGLAATCTKAEDCPALSHEADCLKYLQGCSCDIKCAPGEINAACEVCGAVGADISYCQGAERVCICTDKCQAATGTEAAVINSECPVCRLAGADFGPQCKGKKLPNATVSALGSMTLTAAEHSYMCWPSGDSTINRPLQIVVNFQANETYDECLQNGYSQWLCDFYLTLINLSGDSITADGCYLAGSYGSYGWIVIPTDGLVLDGGVTYPVVSNYDATLNYKDICESVKNFTAAIYVHPDILVANPDMVVTLQLRMTNPEDSSDTITIGSPLSYSAATLAGGLEDVRASFGGVAYASVGDAIEAAVAGGSDAQVSINTDHELPAEDASDKLSLKMLLGARLTVSGEVKLASVSGGAGSVVLKDADTVLTLSNKAEDGTVVSGVENMMVKYEEKDGKHVYRLVAAVAKIGDKLYETFQEAMNAAAAGDTVTLLTDVSLSNKYSITKSITIDGNGKSIIADNPGSFKTGSGFKAKYAHLLGVNASNVTLKNITLDSNNSAGGVNVYEVSGVLFQNVAIINSSKGAAGLTVNKSGLTAGGALTVTGNAIAIDVDNNSTMVITDGTVVNCGDKTVRFTPSNSTLKADGAVDAQGNPCFVARDNAYYFTLNQMKSRATGYTNGLTLLTDIDLTDDVGKDLSIRGTIDLNGHDLSSSGDKIIKASGNMTVKGEGELSATIELNNVNYTITSDKELNVTTQLEDYVVLREDGKYFLAKVEEVEASIGEVFYRKLTDALAAVKDGETITLLQDVELTETLDVSFNSDFDKISIAINGNGKTIKAVEGTWGENTWFVDVAWNVTFSNLTFDGNNTGCRGVQFYTSNSSLTNVTIKNISADKWGYTDYALHVNASNVSFSGVSFSGCKHGHVVVDMGSSTGRTESVANATGSVSGATVILNAPSAKLTAAQGSLNVIKGTDTSVTDHVIVYANGSYVLIIPVAQVGDTLYESLDEAIAAAAEGGTVKLLKDIAGDVTIGKNLTFDLNERKLTGDITVAQGKTLSVSEEDLAAAGSLSLADSLGDVKVGNNVIGLEDGTIAATSAGLSVTPSGSGKSYVRFNGMFVGVPAGSSLIVNADGSAKIPAGGSVVFAGSFEVPVAAESALAADGTLTLYPAEVQDCGYGKVTVTYGEGAKSETVFVPAGKSLTVKADKNGNPVYDSSAEEDPIVTAGSVEKPKLSITPSKKAFYKFGLGTLSFTCNGFCDTLETVSVDGIGLNDTAYTIQRGSTIVKLKNDYLKTLALGDHTLKLTYADGQSVTATISIVNTPVTGDSNNLAIWLAVLGLSGMLCTAAVLVLKRRRA